MVVVLLGRRFIRVRFKLENGGSMVLWWLVERSEKLSKRGMCDVYALIQYAIESELWLH